MKKTAISLTVTLMLAVAIGFISCNGENNALQSQVDSLTTKIEEQAQDLDYYQSCLNIVSDGLDSIAAADSSLMVVTGNKEGTIDKETVKKNLMAYAEMLTRQHERIQGLEQKLNESNREVGKIKMLLDYLNKQIAEKDATIRDLQERIDLKDFNINRLQAEISRLNTVNTSLESTVKEKEEVISYAQEMLNEAYYIIGTNKELKNAGVLSQKFLGKAKMNNDINISAFKKIDIRHVTQIPVNSKSVKIHSAHPSNSYTIQIDKRNKTSIITIIDEIAFWSLTHYLVIEK